MFDFVRELDHNNVMVGRIVCGQRHSLYCINVDRTYGGKDWCTFHGMKLIDRVYNIEKTVQYEIWASDDMQVCFQ